MRDYRMTADYEHTSVSVDIDELTIGEISSHFSGGFC